MPETITEISNETINKIVDELQSKNIWPYEEDAWWLYDWLQANLPLIIKIIGEQ